MPRLNAEDRKAALLKKQATIAAQLKAMDAKAKDADRKADTRRKVIAGALALEHLEKNPDSAFAKTLTGLLDDYAKPDARHLFPFLPAKTEKTA